MSTAVVIGIGRSGAACARVLADEGYTVRVVDGQDSDAQRHMAELLPRGVDVQLGGYTDDVIDGSDMVCPSPGVRWDAPLLQRARALDIPVRSEIDLFLERCPAPVTAITGTNGKTTTTSLTAAVIAASGMRVHRGGNIGETVLDRLATMAPTDRVVLELSSFQIESLTSAALDAACVLNVTPDHLDRHGTLEKYAAIKARIIDEATGVAVLNHDDPVTLAMAARASAPVRFFGRNLEGHDGASVVGDSIVAVDGGRMETFLAVGDVPMYGRHNIDNVLAAVCLARAAGVSLEHIANGVRSFSAVDHRLQPVRDEDGVLWINDSKATNIDAALKALDAFGSRPIVWIGGGSSKGVPPDTLATAVAQRARAAIICGATGPELDAALAAVGYEARHLVPDVAAAVRLARDLANPGDVVLLAPGYASFDQFSNFEERGRTFAALVNGTTEPVREEV